jgi:hypothetical protein
MSAKIAAGSAHSPFSFVYTATEADHPFSLRKPSAIVDKLLSSSTDYGHNSLDLSLRNITSIRSKELRPYLDKTPENIFAGSDVEIVADDAVSLSLNQIHESEAHYFNYLFHQIENGSSSLQFSDVFFKERVMCLLKLLALRPSGRLLIHNLANASYKILIEPGAKSSFKPSSDDGCLKIQLNLNEAYYCICEGKEGPVSVDTPNFIVMAHEMVHALHFLWKYQLYQTEGEHVFHLFNCAASTDKVPDLDEQMTIFGIPGEQMICENSIRYEFAYPPRIHHATAFFPPFSRLDADRIHTEKISDRTRMEAAAEFGLLSEMRKLIAWGAKPTEGLHPAALEGHTEALRLLAASGANLMDEDEEGGTVLHDVAFEGPSSSAKVLLKYDVEVNKKNKAGLTPLHLAAFRGRYSIAKLLLRRGAAIQALDKLDHSPLYFAVLKGHRKVVALLISNGARIDRQVLTALKKLKDQSISSRQRADYLAIKKMLFRGLDLDYQPKASSSAAPTSLAAARRFK